MSAGEIGVIETTKGTIKISFFPEAAPNHVSNFKKLASEGFYDGIIFHRIIPGFMVQGGCPNTRSEDRRTHGTGGPGHTIKAEFNDIPHDKGIVSMARKPDPDSAGSQFFICVADAAFLDRQYSAFGRVVRGMEVADAIVSMKRDAADNPNERVEMKVKVIAPGA